MRYRSTSVVAGWSILLLLVSAGLGAESREPVVVEEILDAGSYFSGEPVCDSCGFEACGGCEVGPSGRYWAHADYLGWSLNGMYAPALVTEAERGNKGAIGPDTTVVYGDGGLLDNYRNGVRFQLGAWLDCSGCTALEGEYFMLPEAREIFFDHGNGLRTIARPFFNSDGYQDSELVSYLPKPGDPLLNTGALAGGITIDSRSEFYGAGMRLLRNVCVVDNGCGPAKRVDLVLGYRHLQLAESIHIREDLASLDPSLLSANSAYVVRDEFDARNSFNGADLGFLWRWEQRRWSLDLLTKLALGSNQQRVVINGNTTTADTTKVYSVNTTNPASSNPRTSTITLPPDGENQGQYTGGGLLAQRGNIGTYSESVFGLVPELGATVGYQLNSRWKARVGYSLLIWTNVVRPGDQIDGTINRNYLPDEVGNGSVPGPKHPSFAFHRTTLYAQGLNLGLEYTW